MNPLGLMSNRKILKEISIFLILNYLVSNYTYGNVVNNVLHARLMNFNVLRAIRPKIES
jgi:hypothetical protein